MLTIALVSTHRKQIRYGRAVCTSCAAPRLSASSLSLALASSAAEAWSSCDPERVWTAGAVVFESSLAPPSGWGEEEDDTVSGAVALGLALGWTFASILYMSMSTKNTNQYVIVWWVVECPASRATIERNRRKCRPTRIQPRRS